MRAPAARSRSRLSRAEREIDQHRGLGHFELEPARARRPARRRWRAAAPRCSAEQSWTARQIERQPHRVRPVRRFGAGAREQGVADLLDDVDLLGDRDELAGRDRAERRMGPARQRLERAQRAGREIEDRLVGEADLAAHLGIAQRPLDRDPAPVGLGDRRREQGDAAAPALLAAVERGVALAQRGGDVAAPGLEQDRARSRRRSGTRGRSTG